MQDACHHRNIQRLGGSATKVLTELGGTPLGEGPGRAWEHGRFRAPYLRDALLDVGVLVETLETAGFWADLERLRSAVTAVHLSPSTTTPAAPALTMGSMASTMPGCKRGPRPGSP